MGFSGTQLNFPQAPIAKPSGITGNRGCQEGLNPTATLEPTAQVHQIGPFYPWHQNETHIPLQYEKERQSARHSKGMERGYSGPGRSFKFRFKKRLLLNA